MRGGRLVALGSALFQVARHIKFNSDSEAREADNNDRESGDRESGEAAATVENQNLRETEGADANKIEAVSK